MPRYKLVAMRCMILNEIQLKLITLDYIQFLNFITTFLPFKICNKLCNLETAGDVITMEDLKQLYFTECAIKVGLIYFTFNNAVLFDIYM